MRRATWAVPVLLLATLPASAGGPSNTLAETSTQGGPGIAIAISHGGPSLVMQSGSTLCFDATFSEPRHDASVVVIMDSTAQRRAIVAFYDFLSNRNERRIVLDPSGVGVEPVELTMRAATGVGDTLYDCLPLGFFIGASNTGTRSAFIVMVPEASYTRVTVNLQFNIPVTWNLAPVLAPGLYRTDRDWGPAEPGVGVQFHRDEYQGAANWEISGVVPTGHLGWVMGGPSPWTNATGAWSVEGTNGWYMEEFHATPHDGFDAWVGFWPATPATYTFTVTAGITEARPVFLPGFFAQVAPYQVPLYP